MEKLTKAIYSLIATVVVCSVIAIVAIASQGNGSTMLGGAMINGFYYGDTTATTTTLSVTSGDVEDLVLDASSGRKYAVITNTGGTIAYLAFTSATSSAQVAAISAQDFTIPLAASGGTYVINNDNLYRGKLIATSTAGVVIRAVDVQ